MRQIVFLLAIVVVLSMAVTSVCAQESFTIVSESCVYNTATRQYVFNIYFSAEPDFYTLGLAPWGEYEQRHDFFYEIDFIGNPPRQATLTRAIRASHVCSTGMLLVTDHATPWHNPLDTIEFDMYPNQKRVSFTVSADLMGGEGVMYYVLQTMVYGSVNGGNGLYSQARVKEDIALPVEHTTWGRIKEMYHE